MVKIELGLEIGMNRRALFIVGDAQIRMKMYDDCDEGVTMDDFMEHVSGKHNDILISQIPDKDANKYGDIIRQLTKVIFRDKLWFVIRHFNKLDKDA